jgi:hypothetical protein
MENELRKEGNPREGTWAKPVGKLQVGGLPADAINLNVHGRQLTGPLQGFGQLWQKTYKVRLSNASVTPAEVIQTWKENFGEFWPRGNYFYAPLTRIEPGEVAVLNLSGPGGMPLSTGVIVIYADDESFTFMNPEGHMFAGWITFSTHEEDGATTAQVQVLIRANDPLWEIVMRLFGFRVEDEFWHATLQSLAKHFGVNGQVQQQATCVDHRLQWSQAKNIWYNAGIRSALYTPVTLLRKVVRRK